jgi:hydrogenase small subunit
MEHPLGGTTPAPARTLTGTAIRVLRDVRTKAANPVAP